MMEIKATLFKRIIHLKISDPPRVVLSFGANIDRHNIIEGRDVYFHCKIEANPTVYKVEWIKNVSF